MPYVVYRGFKYSYVTATKWVVTLPSGIRSVVDAASEEEIKAKIDAIIAAATP